MYYSLVAKSLLILQIFERIHLDIKQRYVIYKSKAFGLDHQHIEVMDQYVLRRLTAQLISPVHNIKPTTQTYILCTNFHT